MESNFSAMLNENLGALALLALILLAALIVLLTGVIGEQKKSRARQRQLEEALSRMEDLLRSLPTRQEAYQQNNLLAQSIVQALDERGRDEAQRLENLGARLDAVGQSQELRLHRISAALDEKLSQNETRMERMRETLQQSVGKLQEENSKKLEEMRLTVDEKLHATLDKRLNESFSQVSERLEMVHKGLGEMQALASGVGDLKKVLTNVKTRGIWGEMQLGTLLAQILSPNQYDENVAVAPGSPQRVEFAVKLPGQGDGTVYLPIDSKFPIEDYERLLAAYDAGDQAGIAAASAALQSSIKTEAKRIASKYILPPHTTDFAIMFLPIEGLYAEAIRIRGLSEDLQQNFRIVLAGPTTLTALLTSLQVGFRTLAIEKRSGEVWQLLGAVKTEFGKFSDLLEATQKRIHTAADSLETAARKSRTIERKLRQAEELEPAQAARILESEDSLPAGDAE